MARRRPGQEETEASSKARERWGLVAILAVTALAFLNGLGGGFVYDDRLQVLRNPTLEDPANLLKVFTSPVWQFMVTSPTEHVGPYYRPLFTAGLIVQYQLFGKAPFGWHVVSLLLHLASTYLVYRLARAWGLEQTLALVATALFGLHPVHSESVAWVSAFPDPLAAIFLLSALLLAEKGRFLPAAGLGLLAMLSKETAVVLPAVIGVRELARSSGPFVQRVWSATLRGLPALGAALVSLLLRYKVLGFLNSVDPVSVDITNRQAWLTVPSVLVAYLKMLLFPVRLAITYGLGFVDSAFDPRFFLSALVVVLALAATLWAVRSSAVGLGALSLLVLFLLPVLNLKAFNYKESLIHDRYLYLPSIGFCILLALGLAYAARRFESPAFPVRAGAVLCALYAASTIYQNRFFKDDLTLIGRALDVSGRRVFLLNYAGFYLFERGDREGAAAVFQEALDQEPATVPAILNLAEVRRAQGRYAEAEKLYLDGMRLGGGAADAPASLGVVYLVQGRFAEGETYLRKALAIDPGHVVARYNLAWTCQKLGRLEDAEKEYRETLRREPAYAEAQINLGRVLLEQGKLADAEAELVKARSLAPGNPVLLASLADVYGKTDRCPQAVELLSTLVAQQPRHATAYTSLGLCFEKMKDAARAASAYRAAIEVAPDDPVTATARERLSALTRPG